MDADFTVLTEVVRRQSADLSLYADFVANRLLGALPAEHLSVQRQRGRFGRAKDDAPVLSVSLKIGDNTYTLSRPRPDAAPIATVAHTVGGIVLSTKPIGMDEWSQQVALALAELASQQADSAAALARFTGIDI